MDKIANLFRKKNDSNQILNKSTYSLVSCGELTPDTLKSWMKLPEEVKCDPYMEQIRKKVEQIETNGKTDHNECRRRSEISNSEPDMRQIEELPFIDDVSVKISNNRDVLEETEDNGHNTRHRPQNDSQIKRTKYYVKMTILLGCWTFFTAVFLTCNEKEEIFRNTAVSLTEEKSYHIDAKSNSVQIKLSGPFLSEQAEKKLNSSQIINSPKLIVWFENLENDTTVEATEAWEIILQPKIDLNEGELRTKVFNTKQRLSNYTMRVRTNVAQIVPFTMTYTNDPLDINQGVIFAVVLLCGLYILIIFEVINRTMAAITVSTCSLAALALVGERPTLTELVSWLDIETLLLLFSMMILVAIMAETGIFDYLAVFTFEVTKGRLWPLIYLLCIITAVLSTFLDNVTTVLLMSPVTIRLCEVMDLDPVPILMFMAIYSNIGGTATPVGDPPNVIVASNKAVIQSGINFTNFTAHMSLGILLVCVQTSLQIRFMFRDTSKLRQRVPREIQDLRHQLSIWRRAADSLPHLSEGVNVVRERLERKITKLTLKLNKIVKESGKRACPKDTFQRTLEELKNKYKIRDRVLLLKSAVAIAFVVTVFFLHSIPELNRVSLGMTALLGAILLLTLADREDLEPILHRVEWSTLLFFASLFVLMEALSKLGLILYIGGLMEKFILKVDESARLSVAIMLVLWVSGTISAFVDNIPLTTMMVRVVISIGNNPNLNLPMSPLIWALLYGACLGGNGTLIGASANVVCAGVAEQHGYKFTFLHFFKVGFPIMIGHLIVSSFYLLVCHCIFTWH
ncbi:P protein-like [Vanessa atalanta]|uniref:P protein-like n=1 Tax=Vanessa atalanta TaxID=42275 RepID=UPI001FCD0588|nr:P protein-like [Vanessa atalanta]